MKKVQFATLALDKIVGGGQAIGTLESGQKALVWGGIPDEEVIIGITKNKRNFVEGTVTEVHRSSPNRVEPIDTESYLSTSPWQIMTFEAEQHYKAALVEEAFELHDIVLPDPIEIFSDGKTTQYRNKVEFSWYSDIDNDGNDTLDLAFFRRGSKGKIVIDSCSLLPDNMMLLARQIRDLLHTKNISARSLKTLLIRCDQKGDCVWQLYTKEQTIDLISTEEAERLSALGGEIIYSDPKSPASRITERLASFGHTVLSDTVLSIPFHYATEGFFQVNIPVYEQALRDMKRWVEPNKPTIDLYSGVGSIGLTIGGDDVTLIEISEHAVREMERNIKELGRETSARAILAASENALEHIVSDACIIVDPPRAGLHADVVEKLLEVGPNRIIYLSCNPVTQARDVALLSKSYGVRHHHGYNFFPRTPHIEHLVVLDKI